MMDAITLGLYLTLMQRVARDNWWTQEGGGFQNHENPWSIGATIGYKIGATSINVHSLGKYSQVLAFTRDDANYNASMTNGCNGDCLPTTWGYNHQRDEMVSVSREWSSDKFVAIAGAGLKRTTWTHIRHESEDGDYAKRFTWRFTQTHYSVAPVLGVGYVTGSWMAVAQWIGEAYRIEQDGFICCAPARDVYQIGITKR